MFVHVSIFLCTTNFYLSMFNMFLSFYVQQISIFLCSICFCLSVYMFLIFYIHVSIFLRTCFRISIYNIFLSFYLHASIFLCTTCFYLSIKPQEKRMCEMEIHCHSFFTFFMKRKFLSKIYWHYSSS